MKMSFTRLFDKVIFKILTLLGCTGLFAACYGPIETTYDEIHGFVSDDLFDEPLPNIQITLRLGGIPVDTTYTDSTGCFIFQWESMHQLSVKAEDIDGLAGGGRFASDSTDVPYYTYDGSHGHARLCMKHIEDLLE